MRKAKAVHSGFATARESATTGCVLAETQRQAEKWESFTVTNRRASPCPVGRLLEWGRCKYTTEKQGFPW